MPFALVVENAMRSRPGGAPTSSRTGARRQRRVWIAGFRSRRAVEHRRCVAHRAADDVLADQAAEQIAEHGTERVATPRRLEADEPAARGGNADRAAAVVRMGERHDAGGDRRGGAAARAARRVVEVPGVVAGPVQHALGRRQQTELGHVGLANRHQARRLEARDQSVVLHDRKVFQKARAGVGRHAGVVAEDVLEEERNAAETTLARPATRLAVSRAWSYIL
jgi:hypothetical protein